MNTQEKYEFEENKWNHLIALEGAGRRNGKLLIKTGVKGAWAWIPYEMIYEQF
jgi:hypothetical protein